MKCTIITPQKVLFNEREVKSVIFPAADGSLGIEKNHAPMIVQLKEGFIRLRFANESIEKIPIFQGFAQIKENVVMIAARE